MAPTSKKHSKLTRVLFSPIRFVIKSISKELYVKLEYRYVTGHKLNLSNPTRYTEKLQYLRLFTYPNNSEVIKASSRIGLREYVEKLGYEANLVNIYGVFNSFSEIDFTTLPNQFVIKCNHASGFNYICYSKDNLDYKKLKRQFDKWMKTDYGKSKVELHYSPCERKIIIEELLLENDNLPTEYKIHVFNRVAKYMYIVTSRNKDIHYNNYLIDWTPFEEAQFNHWTSTNKEITKPDKWDEMVKIAESLAKSFPFVRVDLYYINKKIYISEMTFTPAKGTLTFKDDKVDFEIGSWLNIN